MQVLHHQNTDKGIIYKYIIYIHFRLVFETFIIKKYFYTRLPDQFLNQVKFLCLFVCCCFCFIFIYLFFFSMLFPLQVNFITVIIVIIINSSIITIITIIISTSVLIIIIDITIFVGYRFLFSKLL